MSNDYGFSDIECKIILDQIERRCKYREMYLKMRTDPCKHSQEAGYVFDPALQRYLSMKSTQFEHFQASPRTISLGLGLVIFPMLAFGTAVYMQRQKFLQDCRCGKIKYRDRLFKAI